MNIHFRVCDFGFAHVIRPGEDLLSWQKSAYSAMIDEKDKLISEFQQELKTKDNQYVQNLKKQAEEVDLLLERMEEQSKTLLKAHSEELREIEKAFHVGREGDVES